MSNNKKYKSPTSRLFNPSHSACAGCGMIMAYRLVLAAAGKDIIVANATGCSEVTTTQYPNTAFNVPWIHSLFENSSSVASGILAVLKRQKMDDQIKVIAVGGDGATFDIGLGQISGMWARRENILYICFDNEAYQNTGYQSSGATPLDANTSTTPPGKNSFGSQQVKKDMVAIALAHGLPYAATATTGYPVDIQDKVKKALSIKGPKYLQIYTPCIPGWGIEPNQTMSVAQLAVQSGFYPIVEYVNGKLEQVQKITKQIPVADFLKAQKRFKHLFKSPAGLPRHNEVSAGQKEIDKIQKIAEENIKKFSL